MKETQPGNNFAKGIYVAQDKRAVIAALHSTIPLMNSRQDHSTARGRDLLRQLDFFTDYFFLTKTSFQPPTTMKMNY